MVGRKVVVKQILHLLQLHWMVVQEREEVMVEMKFQNSCDGNNPSAMLDGKGAWFWHHNGLCTLPVLWQI